MKRMGTKRSSTSKMIFKVNRWAEVKAKHKATGVCMCEQKEEGEAAE